MHGANFQHFVGALFGVSVCAYYYKDGAEVLQTQHALLSLV